jgi:hypothetical protein
MKTHSRISPRKRTHAARLIRQGKSYPQVAKETGIGEATIARWMSPTRGDPDFLSLVRGAGVLQVGPVRLQVDHDAPLLDEAPDESLVWITRTGTEGKPEVLGSVAVQDARILRAVFVTDAQRARDELAAGRIPHDPDAKVFPLRADALPALADPDDVRPLCDLTSEDRAAGFRAWLGIWHFKSGEDKQVRTLGEALWEGQLQLADTLATEPHVYLLKARKLGQSTIAVAYAAFCARVRDEHARVHCFSYRERAANRLLEHAKFGLQRLPEFLRLPLERETLQELVYDAGGNGDTRTLVSYPMSKSTAVEETSTHALLDEMSDWPDAEVTFQGLEPTFTAVNATSNIVTTGNGPQNWSATYWQMCKDGDGLHEPVFLPATARPGRDETWLARKRRTMTASGFRSEYAMSEADALAGPAEREFGSDDIAQCVRYPRYGPNSRTGWPLGKAQAEFPRKSAREPRQECRYIIGVDVGKKDATVLTCVDVSSETFHVAGYFRYVGASYPRICLHIARVAHEFYPAPVAVESNSMGQAVIDSLQIPNRVISFHTNPTSKAKAIEGLASRLQHWTLQYDARALPQLHNELLGYTIPDDNVTQDSVMSLAIAIDCAPEAYSSKNMPGRVIGIVLA